MQGIDGLADADPQPASDDASFRRYFRVHSADASFVAMDAPPEREDCKPFMTVAGYFEGMELNAPRILEANVDEGFLLLSDLGSTQYLDRLRDDASSAPQLYDDAISALALLQSRGGVYQSNLPPYDVELLSFELSLFRDWFCKQHLQIEFDESDEANWQRVCELLVNSALDQPQVFVHRDYHSRNLMVVDKDNPGILDFQDAVEGPLTYDLVSLLEDSYIQWPRQQITEWALSFYAMLDTSVHQRVGEEQFLRYFELMGVQRHLKVAGIFARLNHRDGKPGYMADIPRTLSYITEVGPRYEEIGFAVDLIEERCLPALQGQS